MEEENTTQDVAQDTPEVTTQPQQNDTKPAGYHPVDLNDLPEDKRNEVDARINYLYRQVKDNSRTVNEYRTLAKQQAEMIEELTSGMGQVVGHLEEKNTAETESRLKQGMLDAFEAGDNAKYIQLQTELIKLEATKANKPKPTAKPKNETNKQAFAGQPTPEQLVAEARLNGEFTENDEKYVESWQYETNPGGGLKRPWALENHPKYQRAFNEMALVFTEEQYEGLTVQEKLAELDRRMGVTPRAGGQTVMGGRLTTNPKTSRITVSPKQQEIAVRTKFGGPGAKSDAEHIEAYRKQIEKSKASKGSR